MYGDAYNGDAYMNGDAYNGDAYMNDEPGSYPDMPDLVDSDEDMPDLVDLSDEPHAEPNSHWTGLLIYIMQANDMSASDMSASDMPANNAEPEVLFRL